MKTIVALYDDFVAAQRATQELISKGIERGNISLVANDVAGEYSQYVNDPDAPSITVTEDATAVGAGTGAVLGGIGGLLVGLGALAIPGIGPIIAAGPLVSTLVGAGIGAMAGGLVGALTNLGVPEAEASYYAEGVRRGGALVTAQVPDDSVDWAMEILDRYHPVDIDERVSQWKEKGWTSFDSNAQPYTVDSLKQERSTYRSTDYNKLGTEPADSRGWAEVEPPPGEPETDPLANPNYRSRGWSEVEPPADDSLKQERSTYRSTDYNKLGTEPADSRGWAEFESPPEEPETDPLADPNYRSRGWSEVEPPADEKNYGGGRAEATAHTWTETAQDDDYLDDEFTLYETRYRQHFDTNYTSGGYPYEQYAPAYRYGYDLAVHPSYSNYSWTEVEPAARSSWEETNRGTWEQFKDAVRHAWEEVKEAVDLDNDDNEFDTEEDFNRKQVRNHQF